VEDLHIPPENIIVSGDSAGGGLALALLMYLRDNDYPLPSGAILMSPWVDLTLSCESWESNALFDVVPFPVMDSHMNPIALYLGEQTEKYLTHPYASPLFGTFEGLPPLLIQAGDAEVLRDEIALLAHKATLAGVLVRHEVFDDAVSHFFRPPSLHFGRLPTLLSRSTFSKPGPVSPPLVDLSSPCTTSSITFSQNTKQGHYNALEILQRRA
jgi:acetyl esterase/lipase